MSSAPSVAVRRNFQADPELIEHAKEMLRLSHTPHETAKHFGVGVQTLQRCCGDAYFAAVRRQLESKNEAFRRRRLDLSQCPDCGLVVGTVPHDGFEVCRNALKYKVSSLQSALKGAKSLEVSALKQAKEAAKRLADSEAERARLQRKLTAIEKYVREMVGVQETEAA